MKKLTSITLSPEILKWFKENKKNLSGYIEELLKKEMIKNESINGLIKKRDVLENHIHEIEGLIIEKYNREKERLAFSKLESEKLEEIRKRVELTKELRLKEISDVPEIKDWLDKQEHYDPKKWLEKIADIRAAHPKLKVSLVDLKEIWESGL